MYTASTCASWIDVKLCILCVRVHVCSACVVPDPIGYFHRRYDSTRLPRSVHWYDVGTGSTSCGIPLPLVGPVRRKLVFFEALHERKKVENFWNPDDKYDLIRMIKETNYLYGALFLEYKCTESGEKNHLYCCGRPSIPIYGYMQSYEVFCTRSIMQTACTTYRYSRVA